MNAQLTGATGLTAMLNQCYIWSGYGMPANNTVLRIYPSTEPFPASAPANSTGLPGTHVLQYSTLTFSLTGGANVISGGTVTAQASAAATLSWFSIQGAPGSTAYLLISDSIGLGGTGTILGVSNLTPALNEVVSITFSMRFL